MILSANRFTLPGSCAQPVHDVFSALVRRKYRIEHVADHAVVDHPGHSLDERHSGNLEDRKIQSPREPQIRIRQDRKREMQAFDGLALIVRWLRRQTEQLRHAEPLQFGKMVAKPAGLWRAATRARDAVPAL